MCLGTQWKVITDIFFQWFETLHTKQYFATQLFEFFKTLTTPALRGWMEDFFLYVEKVKSNQPTQDCLSKKEVKEVSQDPAAVRHLNFRRQAMVIAEESRSFIFIFLNPLYKKTKGFQYKSGVENQTARLHAIKQRAYAYDGKAKCDHAARAQMARDRRREGRGEPISNKSDEYRHFFANLFSEYMAKMPAEIINKHWPTFILCGRPAGRNGCTSLNSGTERIFVNNCRIKSY
jgi:hypothetical protein